MDLERLKSDELLYKAYVAEARPQGSSAIPLLWNSYISIYPYVLWQRGDMGLYSLQSVTALVIKTCAIMSKTLMYILFVSFSRGQWGKSAGFGGRWDGELYTPTNLDL